MDDNLNGLIDEDYSIHYQRVFKTSTGTVYRTDLRPLYYRNYFTGAGLNNTMIDESQDSGPGTVVTGWVPDYTQSRDPVTGKYPGVIKSHWSGDENGNWDFKTDDVGADGVPGTHDQGEGDGIPTEGESHFDKTDANEADQIGLTSFNFFNQTASPAMNNSELLWNRMLPGYFDVVPALPQDGDFIFSSGYFSLSSLETQRASLALIFGQDSAAIFENKQIAQAFYDSSYNFIPTEVSESQAGRPFRFSLSQNYPNPFNPTTAISYELSANGYVSLKIFDVLGREIKTLVSERQTAGKHSVTLDASGLPSGVYFYRLQAGTYSETKKLLLLK